MYQHIMANQMDARTRDLNQNSRQMVSFEVDCMAEFVRKQLNKIPFPKILNSKTKFIH